MFYLGVKVKDTVTGYSGTVTAVSVSLRDNTRCLVEATDSTGRPTEYWYPEDRLKEIKNQEEN